MDEKPWSTAGPLSASFGSHPCVCRSEHAPPVPWTHAHHIWPKYAGGPDTPENIVYVCPSTHDWIHIIWREFERSGLSGRQRHWPHYAYEIAVQGWKMMSV